MKFNCLQQDLISSIQTVQKAATSKGTSPIYQYIYVETLRDEVRLIATNQSQTISNIIPAQIDEPGKILLPTALFRDIISKMPSVMIEMKSNDRNLMNVSYTNMKYAIQGMPVGEFTFMDNIEGDISFEIKKNDFKSFIDRTFFTASIDETKPTLNGIMLKCQNGKMDAVTSDSFRLSLVKGNIGQDISFEIIVPAKLLHEILATSGDDDEITLITFNSKYIKVKLGKTTLVTGLISGKFVNYEAIIPKEYKTKMSCSRQLMISILERAVILSDKDTLYPVRFEIGFNKLLVSSNSSAGEAFEEINVKTEGDSLTIGFNSKQMIDLLRNADYDDLEFEFISPTRTCVIRPVANDDMLYLITPLRL